jgi:flagellar hook-associated protein 3 FlgL
MRNLSKNYEALSEANHTVSSGKKIYKLSDDPVGLVTVLDLRSSLQNIDQLGRNIEMGRSWLDMGESALTQIEGMISDTQSLCVEMSSATKGSSERASAAAVVDNTLREVLTLVNTQVNGRYIFSGTNTDVEPFFYDENSTGEVLYQGNGIGFSVKIGKDHNIEVGRNGEEIIGANWGDGNIFKTLVDLKDALRTDDVGGIQDALGKLENHAESIRSLIADTGSKITRMMVKQEIISDLELAYTTRKTLLEDVDMTEAIMQLEGKELAYQAALASSAKMLNMSILNFL